MRDGVLEWFCFWGNCCVICRLGVSVLRLGWVAPQKYDYFMEWSDVHLEV